MLKDGELAAEGDDQPYVFEESPSCQSTLTLTGFLLILDSYQRHHERVPTTGVKLDGLVTSQWSQWYSR